jgi:shikimate dehydrogenase
LERCRADGFRGVNITHPYKKKAFTHVKTGPGFPEGLTSVNTVLFQGDEFLADNTDYSGCCRAFRTLFGDNFNPGRVLMLGAGGVGVAIAHALKELGADELILQDIKLETARELIAQLSTSPMPIRLAKENLAVEMQSVDGLINATPIGMFQYPGNPFPDEGFSTQRWAFDAVYTPENTQFLQTCRSRGIQTLSGFQLFLYQGLDAFERFTGIAPDAAKVEPAFLERFPLE